MCAPAALAIVAVVGTLASTATQIRGQQQQAKAAKKQADYEYEVSKYEAELERQAGQVEQMKHGIAARRAYGLAIARSSKFGSDLSFGSTADSFVELRKFQAFEQDLIKRNADTAVLSSVLRGREARARGKNAKVAATYASIGTAFSGLASAAGTAYTAWESGGFDDLFGAGARPGSEGVGNVGLGTRSAGRLTSGQRRN